jgi:putative ABC transport system permease protein
MNYLISMAFRNLNRNRRRSLLAFTSIFLSIFLITCLQGLLGGFLESMVRNYTKNETGHVRITTDDFQKKIRFMPVTTNIANPGKVIQAIEDDPALKGRIALVTQRIAFGVLLFNGGNSKTAQALAGDPETEKNLLLLQNSIEPGGRYIEGPGETIIGAKMAETLKLPVGGTLKVMADGADYGLHLKKFTVVGIFRTGVNTLDDLIFQIPLDDAKSFLRTGDAVQQIIVMLDNYREADKAEGIIRARLDSTGLGSGLSVQSWTRIGDYPKLISLANSIYQVMFIVIAFLGAFIVTNIMMMVVLERKKEIGILKSMGMPRRDILFLFLAEGSFLGLIGSVAGVGIGFTVVSLFNRRGLDFTRMMSAVSYPVDNIIHPSIGAGAALVFVALGTIVCALVSIAPSRRAARMNAIEAIRSV